jgi:hypothetical protein
MLLKLPNFLVKKKDPYHVTLKQEGIDYDVLNFISIGKNIKQFE